MRCKSYQNTICPTTKDVVCVMRGPSYLHIATNAGDSNSVFLERCQGFVSDLGTAIALLIFHSIATFLRQKNISKSETSKKFMK